MSDIHTETQVDKQGALPDPAASMDGLAEDELEASEANELLIEAAAATVEEDVEPDVPLDEALRPAAPRAASRHGDRAIRLAITQKGMREEPCPTNKNAYSRYFGYGAQHWCADFVSWCLDRTGDRDKKVPWGYPSSVENITRWARERGLIQDAPRRGHIFTYTNGAHTGFVTNVRGEYFTTIEGNTKGPGGSCCWVYEHVRRVDGPYHFVRYPD